jgi:hypothetical protein
MNYLGNIIIKNYFYISIKYIIIKDIIIKDIIIKDIIIKDIIKLIENRNLLIKTVHFISLVYFINPKLALYLINEINKYINIYNIRKDLNN